MACTKLPVLRETLDSEDKNGSDLETKTLDLESGTIHELNKSAPGMWQFRRNPDLCCIYRVPTSIREVNPEAYTPQLLIIGPLHHSLKSQALKSLGDITNTKSMDYLNMEEYKKIYLEKFAQRFEGKKATDGFRRIIEEEEETIRASYSASTVWIPSQEFVDMILHDSVFILEFILRTYKRPPKKTGDPLIDENCLSNTVTRDLMLLENQLPYFILEKLFDPIVPILRPDQTFRELITHHFVIFHNKIGVNSKFVHFTDLNRCALVETLPDHAKGVSKGDNYIKNMHNAHKLDRGGVKFEAVEPGDDFSLSLKVRFVKGCLKMSCLLVQDDTEMILRNVMALEQCHYPREAHVCNYIIFLDYLIDTDRDVDFLVEKGIIKNWIGQNRFVANMVNKLCLNITDEGSYYSNLAEEVSDYYSSTVNSSCAILKRVYFGNLWTGTATVTATLLLLMTIIQAVDSILSLIKK